jgi:hypothetical protein
MADRNDNTWKPAPEELAAYVDGRLDARRQRELDTWLSRHPEMTAELLAHKRLARLWRRAAPESPTDARWSLLRYSIFARIADRATNLTKPRRWWILPIALGAVAASSVLAFVIFRDHLPFFNDAKQRSVQQSPQVGPIDDHDSTPPKIEVLEVLSADEVEIITMDLRDSHALVVGEPPIRGDLVLLTEDEIEGVTIQPDDSDRTPEIAADTPMLWVPIRASER